MGERWRSREKRGVGGGKDRGRRIKRKERGKRDGEMMGEREERRGGAWEREDIEQKHLDPGRTPSMALMGVRQLYQASAGWG